MSALFIGWVHGRTVPVTLARVWSQCWRSGLLAGTGTAIAMLPLKWLIDQHIAGVPALLLLLAASGLSLLLAGLGFVLNADERAMLRQRLSPRLGIVLAPMWSPMKALWLRHAARPR